MTEPYTVTAHTLRGPLLTREEIERATLTPVELEQLRAWQHEARVARKLGLGDIGPCPFPRNKKRGQSK